MTEPPHWLSELQGRWSDVLRSPLDAGSGTFRERRDAYPLALRSAISVPTGQSVPSAEDRLALYHQQYWMRLFTALQGRLPRFAFAIGYFHFNHLASLHLQASPPRHFDLERAADGLDARIEVALGEWQGDVNPVDPWTTRLAASRASPALLVEALCIDRQERRVFEATFSPRWYPTPSELAALSSLQVRTAPSLELVTETWDLMTRSPFMNPAYSAAPLRKLPGPRHWALYRTENAIARLQVSRLCAAFLAAIRRGTFGDALTDLEASVNPKELETVRTELPRWIQLALTNHWWIGASQ